MKVLVVLVLAVFTGCNASLLFADQSKTELDKLIDKFSDYANVATRTTYDTVEQFKQSEFGRDLSARLEKSADAAGKYGEELWKLIPQDVQDQIGGVSYGVMLTADDTMRTIKKKLDPIVETMAPLAEKISSDLTLRAEQVTDMTSLYVEKLKEKLKEKLDPLAQNIEARFQTFYDSFVNTN